MFKQLVLSAVCAIALAPLPSESAVTRFKGYPFEASVISNTWEHFPEVSKNGSPWLQVTEGAEYSIVINNPLPVRVAVAVTIDGLNTIDGKQTTPDKAQKWMIDAKSSLTLRGWQTDRSSLRRFVFTNQDASYADWKERRDRKNYTRNLGVIGVAYFWNKAELKAALNPPRPFLGRPFDKQSRGYATDEASALGGCAPAAPARAECEKSRESKAGTGMGTKETNTVYDVEFHYDAGMYRAGDALAIYYEFAKSAPLPRPFVSDDANRDFAPEMPW